MGFNLHSVGFVGLLGSGGTPAPPAGTDTSHYGYWEVNTGPGVFIPAVSGVRSAGLWMRQHVNMTGFLADMRQNGAGYLWVKGDDSTSVAASVNGVSMRGKASPYDGFPANTWVRVYLEFATMAAGWHFFCRFTAAEGMTRVDFAALTLYARPWTLAEQQETSAQLPTDSLLARYDGRTNASQLLDTSGNNRHGTVVGNALPIYV